MSEVSVVTFDPKYIQAYIDLNREWIEKYFKIEEMDIKQLQNSKVLILDVGGEIFFALKEGAAVGVCAMIPHGERSYELAKMAVLSSARGHGIGDILMQKAIKWARCKGAESVTLLSNTALEPAISLYKKHGFETIRLGSHPDYERCNIEMRLRIERP